MDIDLDIESLLYAQIHHDLPNATVDNNSNSEVMPLQPQRARPQRQRGCGKRRMKLKDYKKIILPNSDDSYKAKLMDKLTSDLQPKPFTPYASFLAQAGINGSNNNPIEFHNISNSLPDKSQATSQQQPSSKKQILNKKNKQTINPSKRKLNKLEKLKKVETKKIKKNKVKENKSRKSHENIIFQEHHTNIDICELYRNADVIHIKSDSDDDDVIVLPTLPQIPVMIDSSDDEIDENVMSTNINQNLASPPSSVLSDDFIHQNDRSRIIDVPPISNEFENVSDIDFINTYDEIIERLENNNDSCLADGDTPEIHGENGDQVVVFKILQDKVDDDNVASEIYSKSNSTEKKNKRKRKKKSGDSDQGREKTRKISNLLQINETVMTKTTKHRKKCLDINNTSDVIKILKNLGTTCEIIPTFIPTNSSNLLEGKSVENVVITEHEQLTIPTTNNQSKNNTSDTVLENTTAVSAINIENSRIQHLDDIHKLPSETVFVETLNNDQNKQNTNSNNGTDQPISESSHIKLNINNQGSVENFDFNNSIPISSSVDPELGWNEEMKNFYHKSWGGENFSTKLIQRSMSSDRNEWHIKSEDRYQIPRCIRRQFKCINCMMFGHKTIDCPKRFKSTVCYMCGETGHREPRCPNTICLNCGAKSKVYVISCYKCQITLKKPCVVCNTLGHAKSNCPDLWRRYHLTSHPNEDPIRAESTSQLSHRTYCCVCAERGHTADNCSSPLRILDYPICSTKITDYSSTYEKITIKHPEHNKTVPYALFSIPSTPNFKLNIEKPNESTFYGRLHNDEIINSADVKDLNEKSISEPNNTPVDNNSNKIVTTATATATAIPNPIIKILPQSNKVEKSQLLKTPTVASINDKLPEFIPLETSMENPTEQNKTLNIESEIRLTKENFNYLFTKPGNSFLSLSSRKFNVKVQMEWQRKLDYHALLVIGKPFDQEGFHESLLSFFRKIEAEIIKEYIEQSMPKNRIDLIKFLRKQFLLLKENCNNLKRMFERVCVSERINCKRNREFVHKNRRLLNVTLFGRGLLGDGKTHLDELIKQLKSLLESTEDVIDDKIRFEIYEHYKYIFTSYKYPDEDYEKYITEYENLIRHNKLKKCLIDRQLFRLIDKNIVAAATSTSITTTNTITTTNNISVTVSANDNNNKNIDKKLLNPLIINDDNNLNISKPLISPDSSASASSTSSKQNKQHDNTINQLTDDLKSPEDQVKNEDQNQKQLLVSQHNQLLQKKGKRNRRDRNLKNKNNDGSNSNSLGGGNTVGFTGNCIKRGFNNHNNQLSLNVQEVIIHVIDQIIEKRDNNSVCDRFTRHRVQSQCAKNAEKPSEFWSRKCHEFVERCKYKPIFSENSKISDKLNQISLESKRNGISFQDYLTLTKLL